MVLRAFSMAILSQAEGERQRVHEKAAETWRDSKDPISRFGSRDCCWLNSLCTVPLQHKSYIYQAVHCLRLSIYPCISPINLLQLATPISCACSHMVCYKISFFAILLFMNQESHRQDPEEFYVKQDRIGSSVFTLLDVTTSVPQGKARLERFTKGEPTFPYPLYSLIPSAI